MNSEKAFRGLELSIQDLVENVETLKEHVKTIIGAKPNNDLKGLETVVVRVDSITNNCKQALEDYKKERSIN
jgi:hypothetical protein